MSENKDLKSSGFCSLAEDPESYAAGLHNQAVTTRELRAEDDTPESERHECPACKRLVSRAAGVVCVSCAVEALRRFGWGPL